MLSTSSVASQSSRAMVCSMAQQTKKELVRLLVLQHGLQKASELSGVPYDLVRQWESRRKRRAIKQAQAAGVTLSQSTPVAIVADRVQAELEENGRETRLSLSRYARNASKYAEQATLRESKAVKAVAETAAITHGWRDKEQGQAQVAVNIAILDASPVT